MPVLPNLPLGCMTRQAIFLRGTPGVKVWFDGVAPSEDTYITRYLLNVRVGGVHMHQCRPKCDNTLTRKLKDFPNSKLTVTQGFSCVLKA